MVLFLIPLIAWSHFAAIGPPVVPVTLANEGGWAGIGYGGQGHQIGGGLISADGWIGLLDRGRFASSGDKGKSWKSRPLFPGWAGQFSSDVAICRTQNGRIVIAFADSTTYRGQRSWVSDVAGMPKDLSTKSYTAFSVDNGLTWSKPSWLTDRYVGAMRGMIQTSDGALTVSLTTLDPGVDRCKTILFRSSDFGVTWKEQAQFDDNHARGDHDGFVEPALLSLPSNGAMAVFRTCRGELFASRSSDGGKSWSSIKTTHIPASSTPPTLLRLSTGRILLTYSPYGPTGMPAGSVPTYGYPGSRKPCTWYRGEIYLRFSDDLGVTWSGPRILLTHPHPLETIGGSGIAYAQMIEAAPGEIWLNLAMGASALGQGQAKFLAKDIK